MARSFLSHPRPFPPGSLTAEPLSIDEIDALPNADRIWATIKEVVEEADAQQEDAYWHGYSDGRSEG